jgi:hypothetical protein
MFEASKVCKESKADLAIVTQIEQLKVGKIQSIGFLPVLSLVAKQWQ